MSADVPRDSAKLGTSSSLESVFSQFETAWRTGQRPRIEDHLGSSPSDVGIEVLVELICIDAEYRRRHGEQPEVEEYVARFPQIVPYLSRLDMGHERRDLGAPQPASTLVPDATDRGEQARTRGGEVPHAEPSANRHSWDPEISQLTRYELIERAGRGGMGTVYKARHIALDKFVAIKIHHTEIPGDRFLREARLLAKIRSPHVVAVHDFELLPTGRSVIAMEWVDGLSLADSLHRQKREVDEGDLVRWMREVCLGMQTVHDGGVLHRDLKPSNILVDGQGHARVADFGLARSVQGDSSLTDGGQLLGTPHYMAPEQAEDPRAADQRSDIYSFGATFYHAAVGQPPFTGPTPFSVMLQHKTEPLTAPTAINQNLSERIAQVIERCLAKAPADRFQSFGEIVDHLDAGSDLDALWDLSGDPRYKYFLARYRARREVYLGANSRDAVDDLYEFPNGRLLRILAGDITEQAVDAIVSSDDCHLTMGGGVSWAICMAGGEPLLNEVERYTYVRPGRAVVTSGGNLPAKFVIHGVTLGNDGTEPSRDLICEIMSSCFYQADCLALESIAFPLLGTGVGCFPYDVCLDTMFRLGARGGASAPDGALAGPCQTHRFEGGLQARQSREPLDVLMAGQLRLTPPAELIFGGDQFRDDALVTSQFRELLEIALHTGRLARL